MGTAASGSPMLPAVPLFTMPNEGVCQQKKPELPCTLKMKVLY